MAENKKNKLIKIARGRDEYMPEETAGHTGDPHAHRPRNLGVLESLFHLDADWGTSLAYILALSLTLTGRLAPVYMIIIAFIMFVVASGYKIVCRHNPDGGGVYSSLRKVNKLLAVVGALLLITDYIVTQALSVTDAYHYLHIDSLINVGPYGPTIWTILILLILTALNWRGPHFSAKFAGIASASTFFLAGILAILALPLVPQGIANIGKFNPTIWELLQNTTGVLLALSGVEAISNMTGIMKDPEKTSRRAINLELLKVIFTTVILGIAMNALPSRVLYNGHAINGDFIYETEIKEKVDLKCVTGAVVQILKHEPFKCGEVIYKKARPDLLVAMGEYLVPGQLGKVYGLAIGIAFGLLLIFAGNTALIGITNVTYALARDNELPIFFTKLNSKYGVPIWGLFTAGLAPIITILVVGANVEALAALYAIGVVGAVTMNLAGTTLQVEGREALVTGFGALMMGILFVTLVVTKMEATIFAGAVLVIGLSARAIQKYVMQYVVKGVEPWLTSDKVHQLPLGQIFLPVFDEYDESLFEYAGTLGATQKKNVIMLYIHEVDTVIEKDPRHVVLPLESKSFLAKAKEALESKGVVASIVYDFAEDIGHAINDYRKVLKPDVTILSPHKQSRIKKFLGGDVVSKVLKFKDGRVLIYSNE